MVPLGETSVGVAGGGPMLTVIARPALQALVPPALEALTNQLYDVLFASAVVGAKVHVPVPLGHPAAVAVTLWLTATPTVFCTSSE